MYFRKTQKNLTFPYKLFSEIQHFSLLSSRMSRFFFYQRFVYFYFRLYVLHLPVYYFSQECFFFVILQQYTTPLNCTNTFENNISIQRGSNFQHSCSYISYYITHFKQHYVYVCSFPSSLFFIFIPYFKRNNLYNMYAMIKSGKSECRRAF